MKESLILICLIIKKVSSSAKAKSDLNGIVKGNNFEKFFDDENVAKLFEATMYFRYDNTYY